MRMNDFVYIDFVIDDYTEHSDIDACCKIAAELGNQGLMYGIDFWFHEAYEEDGGAQVLKFGFNDKHEAMIIKLAGIEVLGTRH
tara:strand:- start:558 stop:809 length:252 start_codon:yes stop_codon:yes gene_type:complete